MHRLKRVMKALSSQIFKTTRNNQKRHDSKSESTCCTCCEKKKSFVSWNWLIS
jgi:hypothetical protein